MTLSTKLPPDDHDLRSGRSHGIRGRRYAEVFLIDADPATGRLVAGVYNTTGLNDPAGTGDSAPQHLLDRIDVEALKDEYGVLAAYLNGPRLWCLDWSEARAGAVRSFQGLQARWVMWLDLPPEAAGQHSLAYHPLSGRRDTGFGIDSGSPAFLLDDPDGDTWVMKSASLVIDPGQTYDSLSDLGDRLQPPPGWRFRAVELDADLVLTPGTGTARITQDELGNVYDLAGGPFSNYTP